MTFKESSQIDASDEAGRIKDLAKQANKELVLANDVVTAVANAAGVTLTVAGLTSSIILRSGAAGVSDLTPTAAALVAAVPNVAVGDCFDLVIRNTNTGTLTLVAGTGVTLEGTTTVAQDYARRYQVRFTNVTSGAQAVTISGIFTAAK